MVPRYERDPEWTAAGDRLGFEELPAVAVAGDGTVVVLGRGEAAVARLDPDGRMIDRWVSEDFIRPHGLTFTPSGDDMYIVDDYSHSVMKFDLSGQRLATIRTTVPADYTGYVRGDTESVVRSGPPFCFPTALAITATGDLLVTDGYGNSRVHRFSAEGELLASWGEPGSEPGQFRLPHGLCVDGDRVLVADRENNRVQVFDVDGGFITQWEARRPAAVAKIRDGLYVVSELGWVNQADGVTRVMVPEAPSGRLTFRDREGTIITELTPTGHDQRDTWFAPHGIAVGASGEIYVSETYVTFFRGQAPKRSILHKFVPTKDGLP